MRRLRIGMAQINSTVGDFKGNTRKILEALAESRSLGVDVITFPELAICGYPPEDLLLKPHFIEENQRALDQVVEHSSGLTVVVGFVDSKGDIYNAAADWVDEAVVQNGNFITSRKPADLPRFNKAIIDALRV